MVETLKSKRNYQQRQIDAWGSAKSECSRREPQRGHGGDAPAAFQAGGSARSTGLQRLFNRLLVADQGRLYSVNDESCASAVRSSSQHNLPPPSGRFMR